MCEWDSEESALTRSEKQELGWNQNEGIFVSDTLGVCCVPSQVPFPYAGPAGRRCCLQSPKLSSKLASVCAGVWCSSSPAGQLRVTDRAACAWFVSSLVAEALISWQQHQLAGSACRKVFQTTPHKGSTRLFVNWILVWDAAKCYIAHMHITKQQGFAVLLHSHARSDIFLFNLKENICEYRKPSIYYKFNLFYCNISTSFFFFFSFKSFGVTHTCICVYLFFPQNSKSWFWCKAINNPMSFRE